MTLKVLFWLFLDPGVKSIKKKPAISFDYNRFFDQKPCFLGPSKLKTQTDVNKYNPLYWDHISLEF